MAGKNLNILILGGGSLGAIYGFLLSQAACTITIAVRSSFPIVSTQGYTINSTLWGNVAYHPHRVVSCGADLPADDPAFDYIFVTTKATGTSLPLSGYPVTAATTIILIQNGIGVEQPYAVAFPSSPLISGVAYVAASQPEPAHIVQAGEIMSLDLGAFLTSSSAAATPTELLDRLNVAGIPTEWTPDIQKTRWLKLLFNGCFATVCAATGLATGEVIANDEARGLTRGLAEEVCATARASGCVMGDADVDALFKRMEGVRNMMPSMLQDAMKGIEMEVEVLCGNVWRIAESHGVQTPRIRTMYAILNGMNVRFRRERETKKQQENL